MARELGISPEGLGKLANHGQEPWKAPLPRFIEGLYLKRFGREQPEVRAVGGGTPERGRRKEG